MTDKILVGTIDATPTWAAMLPALLALVQDGSAQGNALARAEMLRMARVADQHVATAKAQADLGDVDIAGLHGEAEVSFHLVTALLGDLRHQLEQGAVPYGMTGHHVECASRWVGRVRAARGDGYGSPVYPGPNDPAMYDSAPQESAQ